MIDIEVRGAPTYYACEEGVLNNLEQLLAAHNLKKCLIIHGEKSWKSIENFFPQLTISYTHCRYNGECSLSEVDRISSIVKEGEFDSIIGIGGGKALDLAKAVGNETNKDMILIPTLASTCAAWTPLSVFYDEYGQFTHYKVFPKSQLLVLIEPRAILYSEARYLAAGIADTLAKWYEADVIIQDPSDHRIVVKVAHSAAKLCRDVLLKHGIQAVNDLKKQKLSTSLLKVIETNIVAGGMVGGFGDRYGRIAGAHAVHNGLTVSERTHHLLHGEKVAYGILVQLILEEKWEEIENLISFYQILELPLKLKDLGISQADGDTLMKIANATVAPNESIHLIGKEITATKVLNAILKMEDYAGSKL
jgi:uncharacterized oxidoreductase